jgi:hypothetical protein
VVTGGRAEVASCKLLSARVILNTFSTELMLGKEFQFLFRCFHGNLQFLLLKNHKMLLYVGEKYQVSHIKFKVAQSLYG